MGKYVLKRLLILIPILFLVSIIAFGLVRLMPGNAEVAYLQAAGIPPSEELIETVRKDMGYDRPLPVQYFEWLGKALHFDFGISYATKKEVGPELLGSLQYTAQLAGFSSLIVLAVSIPMGIWSAVKANKAPDNVNRVIAFVGASMPSFWLGPLLVQLFALALGWLPVQGATSFRHLILPAITMSVLYFATYSRLLRNSLLENMHKRFVTYSRARGVSENKIVTNHVLRTSMIPVVTTFGINFGHMIAGSTIVEVLFSWPGLGRLIVGSIAARDFPMIQGYIVLMAVVFILVNLATDLITVALDPRMREAL